MCKISDLDLSGRVSHPVEDLVGRLDVRECFQGEMACTFVPDPITTIIKYSVVDIDIIWYV